MKLAFKFLHVFFLKQNYSLLNTLNVLGHANVNFAELINANLAKLINATKFKSTNLAEL